MRDNSTDNNTEMREAFAAKIKKLVGTIRQNIKNHGGEIDLVSIDPKGTVKLRLWCGSEDCPEAKQVLETGVKELLKQRIPEVNEVVTVD